MLVLPTLWYDVRMEIHFVTTEWKISFHFTFLETGLSRMYLILHSDTLIHEEINQLHVFGKTVMSRIRIDSLSKRPAS